MATDRRRGYKKGYDTGRKFDRNIKLYMGAAFILGMIVELLLQIIF